MRTILALATAAMTVLAVPAFAQEVGAPGATGVGPGMTGSNPPIGGMRPNWTYNQGPYSEGPDYDDEYSVDEPDYYGPGYGRYPGMREGRTAAEDAATPVPSTVRGSQVGQESNGW